MEQSTETTAPDNTEVQAEETLLDPAESAETQETADAPESAQTDPATEKKADGDAPLLDSATEEKQEEEKPQDQLPESYEFELPEGFAMDDAMREEVGTFCRELKLTQEGAQKMVDLYVKRVRQNAEASQAQLLEQRRNWRQTVRSDPKFKDDLPYAKKGMKAFLTDEESVKLFRDSWLSDHPALFRGFAKIGRLLGEDGGFGRGGGPEAKAGTDEERFPVK